MNALLNNIEIDYNVDQQLFFMDNKLNLEYNDYLIYEDNLEYNDYLIYEDNLDYDDYIVYENLSIDKLEKIEILMNSAI